MSSANSGDTQRWDGITRPFAQEDVERLRGSVRIEYTLAKEGAERLWALLNSEPQVTALGALTGNHCCGSFLRNRSNRRTSLAAYSRFF